MHPGLIGGIAGSVIGFIGGIIGTYVSIKNTGGPKERAFMIKCAIIGWIGIIVFLILLFSLPKPYSYLMWVIYAVSLPVLIIHGNKRQNQIRNDEKPPRKN